MAEPGRPKKLVGVYWRVSAGECLVFHFKERRWEVFESYQPFDIADALKVALGRIDEAIPGTLARAAKIDDDNWMRKKSRKRHYIAEERRVLRQCRGARFGGRLFEHAAVNQIRICLFDTPGCRLWTANSAPPLAGLFVFGLSWSPNALFERRL
jgi:hypothetical protein